MIAINGDYNGNTTYWLFPLCYIRPKFSMPLKIVEGVTIRRLSKKEKTALDRRCVGDAVYFIECIPHYILTNLNKKSHIIAYELSEIIEFALRETILDKRMKGKINGIKRFEGFLNCAACLDTHSNRPRSYVFLGTRFPQHIDMNTDFRINSHEKERFFKKFKTIICSAKNGYIRTAISRYLNISSFRSTDTVIDAMIALEALVGDDSIPTFSSISYKVSLRASFLLENNPMEREKTFRLLRNIYAERSKLVHGKSRVTKDTSYEHSEQMKEIVKRLLLLAIELNKKNLSEYSDRLILGVDEYVQVKS